MRGRRKPPAPPTLAPPPLGGCRNPDGSFGGKQFIGGLGGAVVGGLAGARFGGGEGKAASGRDRPVARPRRSRPGAAGVSSVLHRQDQPAIRVVQPADWQFRRLRIDSQLSDRSKNHHRTSPPCSHRAIHRHEGGRMTPADNSGHRNGTALSRDRRRSRWAVPLESAMSSRRTLGGEF